MRELTYNAGSRIFTGIGPTRLFSLCLVAAAICCFLPIQVAASPSEPVDSDRFSIQSLSARSRGESMAHWILRRSSPYIVAADARPPAEVAATLSRNRASTPFDSHPESDAPPDLVRPRIPDFPEAQLLQPAQGPPGLNALTVHNLQRYDEPVRKYAQIHGLDPNLIRAVIYVESAGDPKATSNKGAQGLMQLMPGTARDMGVADVFNPAQNIFGGSRYLSGLLDRYDRVDLALWAYNAGPGAVQNRRLPMETKRYIPEVLRVKSALDAWGL